MDLLVATATVLAGHADSVAATLRDSAAADSLPRLLHAAADSAATATLTRLAQRASPLQIAGGIGFGALVGWYTYFVNRHRKGDVQLTDLVTVIGVLGGGAILKLFPAGTDLFGGYGIGLALGFFGYFACLLLLVLKSKNFDWDWFLDGRRKDPEPPWRYDPQPGPPLFAKPGEGVRQ